MGLRVGAFVGTIELEQIAILEYGRVQKSRIDITIQKRLIINSPAVGFRVGDFVGTVCEVIGMLNL